MEDGIIFHGDGWVEWRHSGPAHRSGAVPAESFLLLAGKNRIDDSGKSRADDGRDPEQLELCDGPAADEQRGAGAAGGHREVGDRDADQVNQRQSEADGEGRACRWLRG